LIDFNDASHPFTAALRYDLDAIVARLRATADSWVPQLFPNGRRVGDEWRLANISGAAPRKQGSCVIQLKGDRAGDWHDFDGGDGGGPLSAMEAITGLSGRDLFEHAAGMAE
jgi:putative DNA primase/helicase